MSRRDSSDSKHKEHGKRLYGIWIGVRQRCQNTKESQFHNYGGRGISIDEEWDGDFTLFYEWAIANGYQDNLTLDRINTDGNYEPINCRWATPSEQSNNRRDNNLVTINGITKTVVEWEREYGLPRDTVRRRVNAGYSEDKLLLSPRKAEKQSGVKGVAWRKDVEKWEVRTHNNKGGFVGFYSDLDTAIKIRSDYNE